MDRDVLRGMTRARLLLHREAIMSDYKACPHCDREAEDAISSNWFPLYRCNDCNELFCHECGGSQEVCPECGSDDTQESAYKVYA